VTRGDLVIAQSGAGYCIAFNHTDPKSVQPVIIRAGTPCIFLQHEEKLAKRRMQPFASVLVDGRVLIIDERFLAKEAT